jgi:predicted transcriptional regulator
MKDLTAQVVSAYLRGNSLPASDLRSVIESVYHALATAAAPRVAAKQGPAIAREKSVQPDEITCLECGRAFTTLRRHLVAAHDITPAQYRSKWRLSSEYPMSAPNYSARRAELVRLTGFGRKPSATRKSLRAVKK